MEQTFEQVNAHVEKYYSTIPKGIGPQSAKITNDKLKQWYAVARPIILLVSKLPLIPKKWRNTMATGVTLLDAVLGGEE
jgi:hypothetical protein